MNKIKVFVSVILVQLIVLTVLIAATGFPYPKLVKSWSINTNDIKAVETRVGAEQAAEKINAVIEAYLNEPEVYGTNHRFKVITNNKNLCVLQIESTLAKLVTDSETGEEKTETTGVAVSQVWISEDKEHNTVNVKLQKGSADFIVG